MHSCSVIIGWLTVYIVQWNVLCLLQEKVYFQVCDVCTKVTFSPRLIQTSIISFLDPLCSAGTDSYKYFYLPMQTHNHHPFYAFPNVYFFFFCSAISLFFDRYSYLLKVFKIAISKVMCYFINTGIVFFF